jgi:hypothetical protein
MPVLISGEDEGTCVTKNVATHLPDYTASLVIIPYYEFEYTFWTFEWKITSGRKEHPVEVSTGRIRILAGIVS